jgi:hypothetical protein
VFSRRIVFAPLAALALLAAPRDAREQETIAPDPVESSTTTPPTPAPVPPRALLQARRSVRVHVRLDGGLEVADVLVERDGTWDFACRAPCTFDAAPGERVRVDVLGITHEPLTFTVQQPDATGADDIVIDRQGRGALVGGLAAFGAGAISLALGMAIIRGAGDDDLFGKANGFVGRLGLLLGAASVVTGTVLIVTRSTAPVVLPSPTTRSQAHEDLAAERAAGASVLRFAPPQLTWTARF